MNLGKLSVLMLAFVSTATHAAVIVPNGNFETETPAFEHWNTGAAATLEADAGPSGTGDYAAHLQAGDWTWHLGQSNTKIGASQGLEADTEYTASFDIKAVAGTTGQVRVGLDTYPGGIYGGPLIVDTTALTAGVWQTLSFNFTTDANPTAFGFSVWTEGGGTSRNVYFDNFEVVAVPEPAAIALFGIAGVGLLRRRRA